MVPLCYMQNKKRCRVRRARGRCRERMEALGFVPGEELDVISSCDGNVIVLLRDARYALDKEQAKDIYVEEAV
jgi:Fe2+ transport system protein FeoA